MLFKMVGGTKVPRNESSSERKVQGTKVPRSRERKVWGTKVFHRDYSFLGTKVLGHEKPQYPVEWVLEFVTTVYSFAKNASVLIY